MIHADSEGIVVLTTLTDPSLAEIIRIALANEGIECEIDGAHQGALPGVLSMRLMVSAEDLDRARDLLNAQANQSMIERSEAKHIAIKNICVPTDYSGHADYALSYGLNLARQTGATLHIVHVVQREEDLSQIQKHADFTSDSVFVTDFLDRLEASDDPSHAIAAGIWSDVEITRSLRLGRPGESICEFAKAEHIDLVIVGTHGRSGIEHALMGSVAEHLMRHSPCPVLTVRPDQHEFLVDDDESGD